MKRNNFVWLCYVSPSAQRNLRADSTGAVLNTYRYKTFGSIIIGSSVTLVENPYTYTCREYDAETGLYYYRARYYDAALGRFMQKDPIGVDGGLNPYVYVGNNPGNATDPSGTILLADDLVILGAIGITVSSIYVYEWYLYLQTPAGQADIKAMTDILWDLTIPEPIPFSKGGKEKGDNEIVEQVRKEIQANPSKDPCDILTAMLEIAKRSGNNELKMKIITAEKYLGCRNKKKRGN